MKKKCLLCLCILGLFVFNGCATQDSAFLSFDTATLTEFQAGVEKSVTGGEGLADFQVAADNGRLRLYYNPLTAETAVEDVSSGVVYRSNPENSPSGAQGAQLILTVYSSKGVRYTWDSNTQAVAYGQYKGETTDNGLNVTYVFGKTEKEYAVPAAVKVETFEQTILPMLAGVSGVRS
jgi:hypothetical protein